MKYLVTGGAGFIGHNVVQLLEQQGHRVLVVDNETTYGIIPKDELSNLIFERKQRNKLIKERLLNWYKRNK